MQWRSCVEAILDVWPSMPRERIREVRYERLVGGTGIELVRDIWRFLGLRTDVSEDSVPSIRVGNSGKWRSELSPQELRDLAPAIRDKLVELAYEPDHAWLDALS